MEDVLVKVIFFEALFLGFDNALKFLYL